MPQHGRGVKESRVSFQRENGGNEGPKPGMRSPQATLTQTASVIQQSKVDAGHCSTAREAEEMEESSSRYTAGVFRVSGSKHPTTTSAAGRGESIYL